MNNNDKRHLKIIEILTYSNDDYTVNEITKFLGISERTFYRDIIAINEEYKYLNIESNDFLSIKFVKNYSIHKVYEDIIAKQPIFNLIEKIMLQDDLSVTYLSAILGVSAPTIYRNIDQFNTLIKDKYDFKIETSPCKFSGDEKDIRAFLTQYMAEAHGFYSWPFQEVDEGDVEELLNVFSTHLGYSSDYSTYQNTKIIVAINLLFYKRGRVVDNIRTYDYLVELIENTIKIIKDNDRLVDLFARFGVEIDVDGVLQVAYPFISERFLPGYPFVVGMNRMPADLLNKIDKIEKMIEAVEKHVDLNNDAKYPLIIRLYNGLALGYYSPYADYILFENGFKFYNSMKDMAPEVMNLIDRKLMELYPLFGIKVSEAYHRHMSNMLVMNWPNFMPQLIGADVTSKVLIVSDLGIGHASMYKFRFKSELINFNIVDVYDRRELSIDWINRNEYNYIISNCDLKGLNEGTELMVISTCPTSRDFDLIRNTFAKAAGVQTLCALPGNESYLLEK